MLRLFIIVVLGIAAVSGIAWQLGKSSMPETVFESSVKPTEAAPMCPWREPDSDLKLLFPQATRYQVETRVLSGFRQELEARLGRPPTGEENVVRLNRVYEGNRAVGIVLVGRVKGEYGAIELVLGVEPEGRMRGLRIQRMREPKAISEALENPEWIRAFVGKTAASTWKSGTDLPELPSEARGSAEAVAQGVRSMLILLSAAEELSLADKVSSHHE